MVYLTEFCISFIVTLFVVLLSYYFLCKGGTKKDSKQQAEDESNSKEETDVPEETTEVKEIQKDDVDIEDFKEFLIKADELKDVPSTEEKFEVDEPPLVDEAFAKNIHTMYKCSRLHIKEIEEQMTEDEREKERLAQQNQLAEIFRLMNEQQEKFGINSVDEIQEQMRMYTS